MPKDLYFVGLKNQKELRKSILLSSKSIIENLQHFEDFRKKRTEKLREIEKLKSITDEISSLIERLKSELPKIKVDMEKVKAAPQKTKEEPVKALGHLRGELDAIEAKLKNL